MNPVRPLSRYGVFGKGFTASYKLRANKKLHPAESGIQDFPYEVSVVGISLFEIPYHGILAITFGGLTR